MNLFDNKKYYNKEDFDRISFEDQQKLFLKIRSWLPSLPDSVRSDNDLYKETILKRIEEVCAYACAGHIPSQDYMGYIYKRGFSDFFPINYKRSIEWNIIAAKNGSKLAPHRMRAFINPAIFKIMESSRWPQIIEFNSLTLDNYFWFLSQYICDFLYRDLNLNPIDMSKKDLIEEDTDEHRVRVFFDRFRDRCVDKAIELLAKQIPEGIEQAETETSKNDGKGTTILKSAKIKSYYDDFTKLDIEDIDLDED